MKTKHILLAFVLLLTSLTIITSCKKYEDGPMFSLRTKKARLTGDWKIQSFTEDGVDITGFFSSSSEWNIESDNTYKINLIVTGVNSTPETGKWKFGEDKDDVYFTDNATGEETAYRILRLKNTELWLRHTDSQGSVTVIKLKQ